MFSIVLSPPFSELNSNFEVLGKLQVYYNNNVGALAFNLFEDKKTNVGYGVTFNSSGITYSRIDGTATPIWKFNLAGFCSYKISSTSSTWKSDVQSLYTKIPVNSVFIIYVSAGFVTMGLGFKANSDYGAIEFFSYASIQTYKLSIEKGVYTWTEK